MQINKNGTSFEVKLKGSIGESSELFTANFKDATKLVIDLADVSYINSVGVKNWVSWACAIPSKTQFALKNLPLVFVNVASTVRGFLPDHAVIESFIAPMVCPKCSTEKTELLKIGEHYKYADSKEPRSFNPPKPPCPKCKTEMEVDFIEAKTCAFLDQARK